MALNETIIDAAKFAKEFGIENESDTFRVEAHCRIAELVLPSDASQETKDAILEEIRKSKPLAFNVGRPSSPARKFGETNDESRTDDETGTPPVRREE